jgi:hypothetical protein
MQWVLKNLHSKKKKLFPLLMQWVLKNLHSKKKVISTADAIGSEESSQQKKNSYFHC